MQKVKEVTHKAKEAMTGGHHDPHPTTKPSAHDGPHSSGLANQVDPRIDSDRDGSHNVGLAHNTGTHGTGYGTGTHGFSGTTGTGYGTTGHTGHTGHTGGYGTTGAGLTGHQSAHPTTQPSTHVGPHSSGLANQVDPRVDSDRDASNNMGLAGGQHATYTNDTTELPDAAKHSPTVFAKMAGGTDPEVGHTGDPADHRRRHSLKVTDTAATLERYGPGQ